MGTITVRDPFTGDPRPYQMPAGGRGYTRLPSLISVWSTAPFLLNNSVGPFNADPSVDGRMRVVRRGRSSRCCGRKSATRTRSWATRFPA